MNVSGCHWMVGRLQLESMALFLMDSNAENVAPEIRIQQSTPLRYYIPHMLRHAGFFDIRKRSIYRDILRVKVLGEPEVPQQTKRYTIFGCQLFC